MKNFKIKSPTGIIHNVTGESIYHAIQKVILIDNFKYKFKDYKK